MGKIANLIVLSIGLVCLCAQAAVEFKEALILVGKRELKVQVADTETTMETGLMYRDSIDPYAGMLFVFDKPQRVSFWMRDTKIPLDIGYFNADGRLLEVYPLFPFEKNPVSSKSDQILYALEMPQGDFIRRHIQLGQFLIYPYDRTTLEIKKSATIEDEMEKAEKTP